MSKINVDLNEYQDTHGLFVVIKDFYKIGSAVMGYKWEDDEDFRVVLAKCLKLHKSPLQVVRLSGPHCLDMYMEYSPYTVYDDYKDLINICMSGDCPGRINNLIKDSPYLKKM